jgi:glycosyltransferase involved in cell wall biosynthesis
MLDQITPVILTLDEEANLQQTLTAVQWAHRVVVVDGGSTDGSVTIAKRFPNVEMVTRRFDSHAEQWNFAIGLAKTEWVIALDADYIVPPELVAELQQLRPQPIVTAYRASFTYVVLGRPLRGSLYPAKPVLFRRQRARYIQDGHTQQLAVDGEIEDLHHHLLHDDRKPFDRWLQSQWRYARLEADKLLRSETKNLSPADRLRKAMLPAPFLAPLFALFFRKTILDGWPGVHYALQRAIAEALLSLCLIQGRLAQGPKP